jgi:tetratricopeptide (TPR) repeat protein/predicted Ser/Thr protein kinase
MIEHRDEGRLPPISGAGQEEENGAPDAAPEVEGYEITGRLGHGGMGTVWKAVQLSTHRQVALKFLGRGVFSSEKAHARFQREVELTARLQHPNIGQIFESGLQQGVYYYAMEFVDGVSLDEYVEEHGLSHRQILELMQTVCEAVQHAHERGVIHRDLKPSNILVTEDGQPHVLDFGMAKALLGGDSGAKASTEGEAAGTPGYMSPEQAEGKLDQTDTRTDVYALGAILFLLLTGESPHDLSGTRYEVLRRIAKEEVSRPREINKDIDRELEALLLKALAHDPKDRYSSAGALAQDIENYLTGEPLAARPPTTFYFLRKRIKKYRVPVAIAASILAVLVGTGAFSYVRVVHERTKAVAARDDARKEADRAEATYESLQNMLLRIDPPGAWGREDILHESLDSTGRDISRDYSYDDIQTKLGDQPEEEAAIRMATGSAYFALGEVNAAEIQFSRALELRRRALGGEHPATLRAMVNLGVTLARKQNLGDAEPMLRYAVEIQRRVLGEEHPETLRAMNNLGIVLQRWGKLDEAEKVLRKCLEAERRVLGEEHRDTLNSMVSLASTLAENGKLEDAEDMLRECLRAQYRVQDGFTRPDTFNTEMNLGILLRAKGEFDAAASRFQACISHQEFYLGKNHRATVTSKMNLALTLLEKGKHAEGVDILKECLETERPLFGGRTPNYYDVPSMVFANSEMDGEPDKAKASYDRIVK